MFQSMSTHGERPVKENGRKRKGVDEYVEENREDFTAQNIIKDGQFVRVLVCRFCIGQNIGARSDRIKEHLLSKKHCTHKLQAYEKAAAAEVRGGLNQEYCGSDPVNVNGSSTLPRQHHAGGWVWFPNQNQTRPNPPVIKPTTVPSLKGLASSTPSQHYQVNHLLTPPLQSQPHLPMPRYETASAAVGGRMLPSSTPIPNPSHKKAPDNYLIRWDLDHFDSNIVAMFTKFRSLGHFVDVTLWCEGKTINCHKMVLSAGSTYFEKLLTENPYPHHPIIFLKDMQFREVTALVDFMYKGDVTIPEDKLMSFLRAARSLCIKGLSQISNRPKNLVGGTSLVLDSQVAEGIKDRSEQMDQSGCMDTFSESDHDSYSSVLQQHLNYASSFSSLPNSTSNLSCRARSDSSSGNSEGPNSCSSHMNDNPSKSSRSETPPPRGLVDIPIPQAPMPRSLPIFKNKWQAGQGHNDGKNGLDSLADEMMLHDGNEGKDQIFGGQGNHIKREGGLRVDDTKTKSLKDKGDPEPEGRDELDGSTDKIPITTGLVKGNDNDENATIFNTSTSAYTPIPRTIPIWTLRK